MCKMNLLTSINTNYFPFAKIFFNSLLHLDDYNKIDKIYIIDCGLTKDNRATINSLTNKVVFIDGEFKNSNHVEVHSQEWVSAVSEKTKVFLDLIKKNIAPLLFIDIDCYFKEDFLHLIDYNSDLVLCQREHPALPPSGYKLPYIASFFGVNNNIPKVFTFIEAWINEMPQIRGIPIETPALCEILRKYDFGLKIQYINTNDVSCHDHNSTKFDLCKIFHLKSDGGRFTVQDRIDRFKKLI